MSRSLLLTDVPNKLHWRISNKSPFCTSRESFLQLKDLFAISPVMINLFNFLCTEFKLI